ncbi:NVEALA domain-containing protein [Parabacteroides bouchesdurhonensis]|uniref:NVEALA domain-containing protein n=1 Tax=Parabacteroides bouchesdurhonensis TaxID=1936995 RepID=UPI000C81F39A|nr:NVEALA domain-containing protein [Parabacteroides bouchesdurhonensis]
MKKQSLKLALIITGSIMGYLFVTDGSIESRNLTSLMLSNVEALAYPEGPGNTYCIGIGDIDCYGDKVKYKYSGYSLFE